MNKKKITRIIATGATVATGITLISSHASATELTNNYEYEGSSIKVRLNDSYKGEVINIETNLRVRSEANLNSKVIGYLNNGDNCEIKGETQGWYRINFNGNEGYVSKEYIKVINSTSSEGSKRGQVVGTGNGLNVRQGASATSAIITYLKDGDIFEIISQSGEWYNIKTGSVVGFVHGKYVKILNDVSTPPSTYFEKGKIINVTSNLRVRQEPNANSFTLGYLLSGQEVEILGESGEWYKINYHGKIGYCHKNYVMKISNVGNSSNNNSSNNGSLDNNDNQIKEKKGTVINAPSGLRVRKEASTGSNVLGTLKNGSEVVIIGESEEWHKIKYSSGSGYVHKDYISVIKDKPEIPDEKPDLPEKPVIPSVINPEEKPEENLEVSKKKNGEVYNVTSNLRVRAKASTDSLVVGYLNNGAKVDIVGEEGTWYKINYQDKVGFVSKDYVKIITESTNTPELESPIVPDNEYNPEGNPIRPPVENNKENVISYGSVAASELNVRAGAGVNYAIIGKESLNDIVEIVDRSENGWYKIVHGDSYGFVSSNYLRVSTQASTYSKKINDYVNIQYPRLNLIDKNSVWVDATKEEIGYNLDPLNFIDNRGKYMFMKLNHVAGIPLSVINEVIAGKGILSGKGQAFLDGAHKYNINVIYLMSHARLETGNGTSKLSNGIMVSQVDGNPVEPKIVYNMYGVGAYDSDPIREGAEYAYKQGWFTPEKAITEGAHWISNNYINSSTYGQNTLYKMRWNISSSGMGWHQYATDIAWAEKQAKIMAPYLERCGVALDFEIPMFSK